MSAEVEVPINRDLLSDLLHRSEEPETLVEMLRAAGISHETQTITLVILGDDS